MNNRLLAKLKSLDALSPTQDGCIRDCDGPLLTLAKTIWSRKSAEHTSYCLFLGFQKAFDSVNHTLLWESLWRIGVRGHLFHIIAELYQDLQTCVVVNGQKSRKFSISKWVLQGDVLSTTVFVIFVDFLLKKIQSLGERMSIYVDGHRVQDVTFTDLNYANDVTVVTETADGMHNVLKTIKGWCSTWCMQVNAKKTEIMIVRPRGCKKADETDLNFSYGGKLINVIKSTKYLGVIFNDDFMWNHQFKFTLSRARKAWRTVAEVCCNHYLDLRFGAQKFSLHSSMASKFGIFRKRNTRSSLVLYEAVYAKCTTFEATNPFRWRGYTASWESPVYLS